MNQGAVALQTGRWPTGEPNMVSRSRIARSWSQARAAAEVSAVLRTWNREGISQQAFSRYELGERVPPAFELFAIAQVLELDPWSLLEAVYQ